MIPGAIRRTGAGPGAVSIIEVIGDIDAALSLCTPAGPCHPGQVRLVDVEGVDQCLIACVSNERVFMMPHGGEAITRRLLTRLEAAGIRTLETAQPLGAADEYEAAMLNALLSASTTLALDQVLDQPRRWRMFADCWTNADERRSERLGRLLSPPLIVLAGGPNIGKSTLLNALAGTQTAQVADAPGTTRDHVGRRIDLGGLLVHWIDMPGLRQTDDPAEAAAIELARPLLEQADLLLAAADGESRWPQLGRDPDLRIGLRSDLGKRDDTDVSCCALQGDGIKDLVSTLREALVPEADLASSRPWRLPEQALPDHVTQSPMAE